MTKEEQKIRALHARKISRNIAAELMGMGHERFTKLCEQYGISWPTQAQAARVTIDGMLDTWSNHAKRLGMDPATLKGRMHKHGTYEDLSNPITTEKVQQFVSLRLEGMSGVVAAETLGHHYNSLHKLATQQVPDYLKQLKQLPRKRRSRAELPQGTQTPI